MTFEETPKIGAGPLVVPDKPGLASPSIRAAIKGLPDGLEGAADARNRPAGGAIPGRADRLGSGPPPLLPSCQPSSEA